MRPPKCVVHESCPAVLETPSKLALTSVRRQKPPNPSGVYLMVTGAERYAEDRAVPSSRSMFPGSVKYGSMLNRRRCWVVDARNEFREPRLRRMRAKQSGAVQSRINSGSAVTVRIPRSLRASPRPIATSLPSHRCAAPRRRSYSCAPRIRAAPTRRGRTRRLHPPV